MNVINEISGTRFELNGVEYFKNFTPLVIGGKLKIVNTYDAKIELTDLLPFNEFTVDGNTFLSVETLQAALLPVLFSRDSLGGSGGGGSSTLVGLTDTNISNPTNEQILVYNASTQKWVNQLNDFLTNLTKSTDNTGANIDMGYIGGNSCNMKSANATEVYKVFNQVLNGNATVLVNRSTEPNVLGEIRVQLSGTSGTANINIGAFTYLATFNDSLTQTVTDFINTNASNVLAETGLTATAQDSKIQFTGNFNGEIIATNVSGDLTGTPSGLLATKIPGDEFEPNTNMHLCVQYLGVVAQYFFLKL